MVYGGWDYLSFIQLFLHVLATFLVFYHLLSTSTYLNYRSWFSRVLCPTRFLKLWISASNHCGRCLHVCFFGWRWSERLGAQGRTAWPGLCKRLPGSRFPSGEHLATGVCDFVMLTLGAFRGRTACRHVDFHLISWTGRLPPKRVREPDYPDANRWKKISWLASMGVASGHGRTFTPQKNRWGMLKFHGARGSHPYLCCYTNESWGASV